MIARIPGALLLALLVLPIAALVTSLGPAELVASLGEPAVMPALRLSLITTSVSLLVILGLGTPLAWSLARSERPRLVESLIELPIVLPPAVVGVALLMTFGRQGALGPVFQAFGWSPAFTSVAVVLAQTVVAAPFFVQSATAAFRGIDTSLIDVSRSLGASPARTFFRVVVPLAGPGLVNGAALAWARALGEFGATLFFAGNLAGRTQTLPLAIYAALESSLPVAQALSILLVAVALVLLVALRGTLGLRHRPGEGR
jgi:molybdate transport system permease protein